MRALLDQTLPQEIMQEHSNATTAKERLKIVAKLCQRFYHDEREKIGMIENAEILSPEFKQLKKESEQRRYTKLAETIQLIIKENRLAKNLTPEKAHDILWAMTGRDFYRLLVIERQWSEQQYEMYLENLLIHTLLEQDS